MSLLESSEFGFQSFKSLHQGPRTDLDSSKLVHTRVEQRILGEKTSKDRLQTRLAEKYSLMKNSNFIKGDHFLSSKDACLKQNLLAVPQKTSKKRRKSARVRSRKPKTGQEGNNAWTKIKEVKSMRKDCSTQDYALNNPRAITMEDIFPC